MKLYFYILDYPYNCKTRMRISECEVEEKTKTYKPIKGFPIGYYGHLVKKEDIGHICGGFKNSIVLLEKNNKLAKEIFSKHLNQLIEGKEKELKNLQSALNAVIEIEE